MVGGVCIGWLVGGVRVWCGWWCVVGGVVGGGSWDRGWLVGWWLWLV